MDRYPAEIQILNFESSEKPVALKKMIRAAKVAVNKSPTLKATRSERTLQPTSSAVHMLIEDPMREESSHFIKQDRRKTITKK